MDVLCFANDWATEPTSKHHLMRRLAERSRVLWIETAGMRRPNLGQAADRQRVWKKLRSMVRSAQHVHPTIWVRQPPSIPLPGVPGAEWTNRLLYRLALTREIRRLGFAATPLMWVFAPHVQPLIRGIRRRGLVYHCVDRWTEFTGFDAALMERWERALCRGADIVLASAEDLVDRCREFGARSYYLPHGVDYDHFARALEPRDIPDDLANIPEPRVGFFGLIDDWVDLDLIQRLAELTEYSFVMLGRRRVPDESLPTHPRVFFLGKRPYASLPDYCRGFRAAIVPFKVNALTQSVNPIKLREYAAAGLPIVSSDLPEVRKCADIAACAADLKEWLLALGGAVRAGSLEHERRMQSERVRAHDWSRRLEVALELIRTSVDQDRAASSDGK